MNVVRGSLVVLLALLAPSIARAEDRAWLGVGLELFGHHALDDENRQGFGLGGGGAVHLELNVHEALGLHVGGMIAGFSEGGFGSATEWYGARAGLRFHWAALLGMAHDDGWIDAHYAIGASGQIARSGFDVGVGYELAVVRGFRIGPFARVQWMSDPLGRDPVLLFVGVSLGVLGDPRIELPERTPDADSDGVPDARDHCPTEPQGARPDPDRPGCPSADYDGDGVPDASDACPTVPAGADPDPASPGCPAGDRDRDGVRDPADACPDLHHGLHPDPARPGCPQPDRDEDTVPDALDACPDEPGAPSLDPARNGCPGLVRIRAGQVQILQPVYFATGRDVILEASFPVLLAVADAVSASGITRLRIEGHTDAVGDDEANLRLSQRRAESVRRWLLEHGIDASVLEAVGLGETRPVESNDTELGRAANRRVEFHIVGSDSQGGRR
jgi:outer membrane protein OmpA-like peptidoglycan-associated protein